MSSDLATFAASCRRVRGVILDFDGLMVDTETPIYNGWRAEARQHGLDLDLARFSLIVGKNCTDEETVDALFGSEFASRCVEIADRAWDRCRAELAHCPVMPGIESLVAEIRDAGLRLGVASSSPRTWVVRHLERVGLAGKLDTIRCSDDVGGAAKPEPDVYLAALNALGLDAAHALAVEDSHNGLAAAKAAGMRCAVVPGPITAEQDFRSADARLTSLDGVSLSALAAAVGMRL